MARFGFGRLSPADAPLDSVEQAMPYGPGPRLRQYQTSVDLQPMPGQPTGGGDRDWKPGLGEILDRVFGLGITDAIDESRARHESGDQRAQQRALRESVLKDPRELLAYMANPSKWGENVSGNYAPANINGGDTRISPGYGSMTAPKMGVAGDTAYTQTPGAFTQTGTVPQSQTQEENAAFKQNQMMLNQMLARSLMSHRQAQDETSSFRAHKAPAGRSGGGGSGKVAPRILGASLPAGY